MGWNRSILTNYVSILGIIIWIGVFGVCIRHFLSTGHFQIEIVEWVGWILRKLNKPFWFWLIFLLGSPEEYIPAAWEGRRGLFLTGSFQVVSFLVGPSLSVLRRRRGPRSRNRNPPPSQNFKHYLPLYYVRDW